MAITLRNTKGSALTFSELDANFTDLDNRVGNVIDSAKVQNLIDSSYVKNFADSDYIKDFIDSAYIQAKESTPTITLTRFDYIADSGQTGFTGADDNGNTLSFDSAVTQVYLNGLLLNPVLDYTLTGKNTVTTATGIDSDHLITITTLSVS